MSDPIKVPDLRQFVEVFQTVFNKEQKRDPADFSRRFNSVSERTRLMLGKHGERDARLLIKALREFIPVLRDGARC